MATDERSLFTLSLTQEQISFIESSWNANGWSLDITDSESQDAEQQDIIQVQQQPGPALCERCGAAAESTEIPENDLDEEDSDHSHYGYHVDEDPENEECPWCLCKPCITDASNQQMWWEMNCRAPSESNSKRRKSHYQRFWVMLLHHGAWTKDAYRLKKIAALQNRGIHAWAGPNPKHPRDIMPDCVLSMVRGWLPNPPTIPYMGHKWI